MTSVSLTLARSEWVQTIGGRNIGPQVVKLGPEVAYASQAMQGLMATEMGEYLVGAYLDRIEGCEFVNYNARLPSPGVKGMGELDVVGFRFETGEAFLCEVATHILGLQYGNYDESYRRIEGKAERQREYADRVVSPRGLEPKFMLWSPYIPSGLERRLRAIPQLEIVANRNYSDRMDRLRGDARKESRTTGNPAYRILQILEHLRR